MSRKLEHEDILNLFREHPGTFVSGEEISQKLGVSRTAVWKKIRLLRDLGYTIDAVTSRGYRLAASPDALMIEELRSGLDTRVVGCELVFFDETDSTNTRARELGDQGHPAGTVVIADRQTAGKGRLGRKWVSPPGVNLYTSVLLRPPILPFDGPQLTFISAVAVARAIRDVSGLSPSVKWPNDILLSGKKVAGLLNEMNAETEGVRYIILGIGVNLNMDVAQFPEDLRYPATSVALEKGEAVSRLAFARTLYRHLDRLYLTYLDQGFAPIVSAWEELCDLVGRQVEVDCQSRILRGTVEGLDTDGALLVRTDNGTREKIMAGDVKPL
ncbi:MAG: biotin--[acetyl-CoA-carboxylase] ligase [Desulfuromonadaceae bacterium GWC2_58_13]|nr:MAG: biotin--[acetyl-CoA-carboxylase] ligase [Desulfuromonadaceae bacterium GWC2_58_13]